MPGIREWRQSMNILAVVAHPDDEVLGCGVTRAPLAQADASMRVSMLCANAEARGGRPDNRELLARARRRARVRSRRSVAAACPLCHRLLFKEMLSSTDRAVRRGHGPPDALGLAGFRRSARTNRFWRTIDGACTMRPAPESIG
jgi:hypothetical protein